MDLDPSYNAVMLATTVDWMVADIGQVALRPGDFLSPAEELRLSAFRFPKRRDEWLLGRWAAKSLAHSLPGNQDLALGQIEVGTTSQGAPFLKFPGKHLPQGCLSISHSGALAFCALSSSADLRLGADLEKVEPRGEAFVLDYFTAAEISLVESCRPDLRSLAVTLIWSAKESMLKALGVGLGQDTRSVEVQETLSLVTTDISGEEWLPLRVSEPKCRERLWRAWWQPYGDYVLTLAAFAIAPADIHSIRLTQHS